MTREYSAGQRSRRAGEHLSNFLKEPANVKGIFCCIILGFCIYIIITAFQAKDCKNNVKFKGENLHGTSKLIFDTMSRSIE